MKEYSVVIKGKPSGPYAPEDLKGLNIKAGTFVKSEEMDDYKEAHEVPELCEFLGLKAKSGFLSILQVWMSGSWL